MSTVAAPLTASSAPVGARTVWLIRHAESAANAGLATDLPDTIPITARGRAQAERVAAAFTAAPDQIIVSGFQRTAETAAPTRRRFPDVPCEVWPVHEFTYLAPEGLRGTTIAARRPRVQAYWSRADPDLRDGEGAESFVDLLGRLRDLAARLEQRSEATIAIFTHGQFIRALLWSLFFERAPESSEAMRRFRRFAESIAVPNASVTTLVHAPRAGWLFSSIRFDHLPPELITNPG